MSIKKRRESQLVSRRCRNSCEEEVEVRTKALPSHPSRSTRRGSRFRLGKRLLRSLAHKRFERCLDLKSVGQGGLFRSHSNEYLFVETGFTFC